MTDILSKLESLGYEPLRNPAPKRNLARLLPDVISFPVPDDYLQFLADRPATGVFDRDIMIQGEASPWARDGLYPVEMLFAADAPRPYDLIGIREGLINSGQLPEYLLAFGEAFAGNRFCLDLRPASFGKIYIWLAHHFRDDRGNLYRIADSFSSFIDKLFVP